MSETTELKSIEEIAREEGFLRIPDDAKELMEAVRRSDRQHWLEVACKAVCGNCRQGYPLDGFRHFNQNAPPGYALIDSICDATDIYFAFTAQEKKD